MLGHVEFRQELTSKPRVASDAGLSFCLMLKSATESRFAPGKSVMGNVELVTSSISSVNASQTCTEFRMRSASPDIGNSGVTKPVKSTLICKLGRLYWRSKKSSIS